MNLIPMKRSIKYYHWNISYTAYIHKILVVSRESAIDNLVLQNLQQPDNHQNSHVQEVLQQWVGLHFKPSRQVGGHFAPVEVRLGQIEFDEVVVVVQNQVDKECELNVDVARGE